MLLTTVHIAALYIQIRQRSWGTVTVAQVQDTPQEGEPLWDWDATWSRAILEEPAEPFSALKIHPSNLPAPHPCL